MALMYAKDSVIVSILKDVEENHKRTQEMNLAGSNVWKSKSVQMTNNLADALLTNTRLTALNLSACMLNDACLVTLSTMLAHNSTIFDLNLADNKFTRPGLTTLATGLTTNTGLITLNLSGHRINSEVCAAFLAMYNTNVTLCKLVWSTEVSGYNLRFSELAIRNSEIDRAVRDGKPFDAMLPKGLEPPQLVPRIVPDPDDEEYGLEVGEAGHMVWCQIAGRWELGKVEGKRGQGQRRKLVVKVEEVEHEIDPKEATQFEPSHAQDLPNMVMMGNLHEAPLLYLLQRRLKNGDIYTWAGDVLISLNPYSPIASLYQVSTFLDGGAAAVASPHVYAISKRAQQAFEATLALSDEAKKEAAAEGAFVDQSVLISGESGAGKTEACKRVLEYLTAASRRRKQMRDAPLLPRARGISTSLQPPWHGGSATGTTPGRGNGPRLSVSAADKDKDSRRSQALMTLSNFDRNGFEPPAKGSKTGKVSVEVLLREASPVLEAFGNAKTIRNDNSSRFGKYVAVQYDADGLIVGAGSQTYLLERSRVVEIAMGERNYHIFYQLLTDEKLRDKWGLSAAAEMQYLSAEPPFVEVEVEEKNEKGRVVNTIYTMVQEEGPRRVATIAGASDAQDLAAVKRGLEAFKMDGGEMDEVWRVVSAVMLLGNVLFKAGTKPGSDAEIAQIADEATIVRAAAALGCEVAALRFPLTKKTMSVVGETMEVELTCKVAVQARDALAKVVYSTLFDYIVKRINDVSRGPEGSPVIGILDIFGFENLTTNSFEQLCINYVNEMLQEQFNETVFAAERRLLKAEGVEIDDGALQSSATRLGLMGRLLATLDEQCKLGERANDTDFLNMIGKNVTQPGICKLEQAGKFSINHYAGKVFYTTDGFVHKNVDTIPEELSTLMLQCTGLGIIKDMLVAKAGLPEKPKEDAPKPAAAAAAVVEAAVEAAPAEPVKMTMKERMAALQAQNAKDVGGSTPEPVKRGGGRLGGGKKAAAPTLGGRLRAGIGEVKAGRDGKDGVSTGLMGLLSKTTTHYIRCVKPNDSMAAFGFEQPRVLQQLQYSGVVEMVRIRRAGYPGRFAYAAFAARFGALCYRDEMAMSAKERAALKPETTCARILEAAGLHPDRHYALGRTMVFLRNTVEGGLTAMTARQNVAIEWFQRTARGRSARQQLGKLRRRSLEHGGPKPGAATSAPPTPLKKPSVAKPSPAAAPGPAPPPEPVPLPAPAVVPAAAAEPEPKPALEKLASGRAASAPASRGRVNTIDNRRRVELLQRAVKGTLIALTLQRRHAHLRLHARAALDMRERRDTDSAVRAICVGWQRVRAHGSAARLNERTMMTRVVTGMFNAAFANDHDALGMAMESFPELLIVRQNRPGQRATLAHAAAAGGAVGVAPQLFVAMHAAALQEGRAGLAAELAAEEKAAHATGEAVEAARLRVAVGWCCAQLDVLGRTPLHLAARCGQLAFVQWAVTLLCTRPLAKHQGEGGGGEAISEGDATSEASELRRGVMSAKLPGTAPGPRKRYLVALAPDALRLYALPKGTSAGSAEETLAAQAASQGAPDLIVACDAFLHRKGAPAGARANPKALQVVLLKPGAGGGQDVLELVADNGTEARFWLAGLDEATKGRGAAAQQASLAQLVAGGEAAVGRPTQFELWEQYALLNQVDWRGEGMVHALVRGLEPGDAAGQGRVIFLAWLLERGANLLDAAVEAPQLKKRLAGAIEMESPRGSLNLPGGSSALELLLARAAVTTSKDFDAACAALLSAMLRQGSCLLPAAELEAALVRARSAQADLAAAAPATHKALFDAANTAHGAEAQLVPPPRPTAQQQRLRLLLLSVARLDVGAMHTAHIEQPELKVKAPPEAVRLAISLVHQPAAEGETAMADTKPEPDGGSLKARAAMFGGGGKMTSQDDIPPAVDLADDLGKLETLVEQKTSAAALATLPKGLLWRSSWSALQLPGEEAALVLLQLVHPDAAKKGGSRLVGWVALSAQACGEHHVQLHPPPLPKSVAEARAPAKEPLDIWLHCELNVAVTGSLAAFEAREASRSVRQGAALSAQSRAAGRQSMVFRPGFDAAAGHTSPVTEGYVPATAKATVVATTPPTPKAVEEDLKAVKVEAATPAPSGAGLEPEARALLQALPAPTNRGRLPPRKFNMQESREQVGALLAAAAKATGAAEYELALRGYLRAFEVTRSSPLLLSIANMHIKLGELDDASNLCKALSEQQGLSTEQKVLLAAKDNEIEKARQKASQGSGRSEGVGRSRQASAWQQKLDQARQEQEAHVA